MKGSNMTEVIHSGPWLDDLNDKNWKRITFLDEGQKITTIN
jgi:hypothetical protein